MNSNFGFSESFERSDLPNNFLEETITRIPKSGKLCNDLKIWRPLTLLNSVNKFISSIIVNRIKPILPSIINPDQAVFISSRFIGETTRLTYDLFHYCNESDKKGLLVILDFAKAFDTLD